MKYIDADKLIADLQQEQKCIFGNIPSEDICSVCSAYCSLRVPKNKVSTSTEIATPSGQVEDLTFEEYLRGVFEINNGIENDPDNLVRIHAPELLKLARKQEQPDMIQWTGNNLKEVIDFTGKSPRFEEWFKSWEEFETYVHLHNDILKLFCEDGSHYEVPVGAWIIKTPEGYNVPSVAKYIQQEQPEVYLEKAARYVYESWMGGTMNDVRRDMVELGKVLNARKEE